MLAKPFLCGTYVKIGIPLSTVTSLAGLQARRLTAVCLTASHCEVVFVEMAIESMS